MTRDRVEYGKMPLALQQIIFTQRTIRYLQKFIAVVPHLKCQAPHVPTWSTLTVCI